MANLPADALEVARMKRKGVQRQLAEFVALKQRNDLFTLLGADADGGKAARAALLSASGEHAGAWLQASPAHPATAMPDSDFIIASNLRLQLPQRLPQVHAAQCTRCGATNTVTGDHAFRCHYTKGSTIYRHSSLNDGFFRGALTNTKIRERVRASKEACVSMLYPYKDGRQGNGERRGDVIIFDGPDHVKRKVLDWMVTHPSPDVAAHKADAEQKGSAAKRGEKLKEASYTNDFHMPPSAVLPLVIETHGCMGEKLRSLIKDLADIAVPMHFVTDPETGRAKPVDYDAMRALHIRSIREQIAVRLQIANAGVIRMWAAGCFVPELPTGLGVSSVVGLAAGA
jgi:hypothetical protein